MLSKKFDWSETIKLNILLLKFVGFWPEESYKFDLYTIYAVISNLIFAVIHNVLQVVNFFFIYTDLQALTASIFIALTQLLVFFKSYYLIKNMKSIKQLLKTLQEDLFQPNNPNQIKIVEPNLKSWKFLFKIYWTSAISTNLFWAIYPILDNFIKEYRLPLLVWYPFKTNKSPNYEFAYLYQMLCCNFLCVISIGLDTFIAALNMYVAAQCDLLCDNLRNISKNYDKDLQMCIKHHKEILKFAEASQEFFNWLVLLQLFTCLISLAFTMFQLSVVVPFSSEFYSFLFYFLAIAVEIFMYCWFGNQVELKSSQIVYAIFESNWIDTDLEIKRKILFFSLRCQTPIKMSALNLFYLSLDTFVKILRSAYSYFAVLKQVNSK